MLLSQQQLSHDGKFNLSHQYGSATLERQTNDKQLNKQNIQEIQEMLDKYQEHQTFDEGAQ